MRACSKQNLAPHAVAAPRIDGSTRHAAPARGNDSAMRPLSNGRIEDGVLQKGFCGLFRGDNTGKMVVVIED